MFLTYTIHVIVMTLAFKLHSIFTLSSGYMIQLLLLRQTDVYFPLHVVLDALLMLLTVFFIDSIACLLLYDEFANFQPLLLVPCSQIHLIIFLLHMHCLN
jgi:hypothetical protein